MSQVEKISRVFVPQPAPIATDPGNDWLDVEAIFRIVRRRIGLIVAVGLVVLLAAMPIVLNTERSYSASARVLFHEPLPPEMAASGLVSETELNLTTEIERLLSRDVAVRVISHLGLEERPEFNPALRVASGMQQLKAALRAPFVDGAGPPPPATVQIDRIVPEYLSHLSVFRAAGSDVVNIGFTSRDADLVATVPNTLIRVYLEQRASQFAARIATAEGWLDGRIVEQDRRLARATAAADALREDPRLAFSDPLRAAQAVARQEELRSDVRRTRAELALKVSALRNASSPEAEAADTQILVGLRRDLDTRQGDLARLLERYGPAHGEVIGTRQAIAELQGTIAAEVARERQRLGVRIEALRQEEARIAGTLSAAQATLAEIREKETRLGQLQRVVDREQTALDALKAQRRAVSAEAKLPATEVEILTPASVPVAADGKGRAYHVAIALLAAGAIALTAALFVEMLDKSVRSHEQLRAIPRIRSAGMVPSLPRGLVHRRRDPNPRGLDRMYRDAVQGVILSLERAGNGKLPQSILMSSAIPSEGKTTMAIALATELRASGVQVLLVDADLRQGRIGERFGVPDTAGFGDYVSGGASLGDVTHTDAESGLSVVPRGNRASGQGVDRTAVEELIRTANRNGQVVIFDGTPALVTTEAMLLAGSVACTLLVVRWGQTSCGLVDAAVARLSQFSGSRIDVVIGRVNLRRQALYGYQDAGSLANAFRLYHRQRTGRFSYR